jgi:epoxyqueuosine reductase
MTFQEPDKKSLTDLIKTEAKELGFFECGISPAGFLEKETGKTEQWLQKGNHAGMDYMERNKEKRYDPSKLVEGAKSVISVLYNYYPPETIPEKDNYIISKYAYGRDYHFVIKEKLRMLLDKIEKKTGKRNARIFVDSAPVLDRAWAAKSGLGFIGKNTMLINRKGGSFFFIGEIIIDLELQYDENVDMANYCGSCTACMDACPTQALKPFEVDARKCISYLTIEHKGDIPGKFKEKFKDRIFGCDICQDVCPWNIRFAKPHREPAFMPKEELLNMTKKEWEELDKPTFKKLFKGTPLERTGYKNLMRNIDFVKK